VDPAIRAFDTGSGKLLWQAELPAGGQAAPMFVHSAKTGREYVVQCAGGHHGLGSKEGDSVVAFTLPR
jgi:quinoprotein glucose dehydrogenase